MASRAQRVIDHLLILATVYVLTFLTNVPDYDLWARLEVGSLFFQTGHVLRHDVFSYLPTKELWIDHEWGTGVVLYGLAKCCGELGIFLAKGLLIYSTFVMVLKTVNLRDNAQRPSPLFFAFLGYALFPGIASLIRSQMFTYLFFSVWVYALERIRLSGKKRLWLFPCTMLCWVNMHGGFVAGVGLVLLYMVGELLNRKNILPYVWIALSIVPVMLLNPYGFALWRYVAQASLMPRPFIPEWQPISLRGPMQVIAGLQLHFLTGYMLLVGMTFVAVFRAFIRGQRVDWTRVVVVTAMFVLSVRHQRHAVFFVLAASALFHHELVGLLDPLRQWIGKRALARSFTLADVARWGLGYVVPALVIASIIPRLSHRMIVDYRRFPVGAVEFIKQNSLSGNVATAFDWGSYASWKLYPQCKVMLDGRYEEVFANDVSDFAMRFAVRQGDWWEPLTRFPTDIVVLPKAFYSQADLQRLPTWRAVYQDHVSVVLLPRDHVLGAYARPDYKDPTYSREDLAKRMVAPGSGRS